MIALSMSLGVGNGAAKTASGPLTPPTVAPVLIGESFGIGSFIAVLNWTASDKTSSAGFGYDVYYSYLNESNFNLLTTVTDLSYNAEPGDGPGVYYFKIIPKNSAGDGPASNIASVTLPGI